MRIGLDTLDGIAAPFDPFAPYVAAYDHGRLGTPPRCRTRPWWVKAGSRWWRTGTRFTLNFPGGNRALIFEGGEREGDRQRNQIVGELDLTEIDARVAEWAGTDHVKRRDLRAALALATADRHLEIPAPPQLPEQRWSAIDATGSRVLVWGPFAPWAPPTYTLHPDVLKACYGIDT